MITTAFNRTRLGAAAAVAALAAGIALAAPAAATDAGPPPSPVTWDIPSNARWGVEDRDGDLIRHLAFQFFGPDEVTAATLPFNLFHHPGLVGGSSIATEVPGAGAGRVLVPGDLLQTSVIVHNDGPAAGTLTARLVSNQVTAFDTADDLARAFAHLVFSADGGSTYTPVLDLFEVNTGTAPQGGPQADIVLWEGVDLGRGQAEQFDFHFGFAAGEPRRVGLEAHLLTNFHLVIEIEGALPQVFTEQEWIFYTGYAEPWDALHLVRDVDGSFRLTNTEWPDEFDPAPVIATIERVAAGADFTVDGQPAHFLSQHPAGVEYDFASNWGWMEEPTQGWWETGAEYALGKRLGQLPPACTALGLTVDLTQRQAVAGGAWVNLYGPLRVATTGWFDERFPGPPAHADQRLIDIDTLAAGDLLEMDHVILDHVNHFLLTNVFECHSQLTVHLTTQGLELPPLGDYFVGSINHDADGDPLRTQHPTVLDPDWFDGELHTVVDGHEVDERNVVGADGILLTADVRPYVPYFVTTGPAIDLLDSLFGAPHVGAKYTISGQGTFLGNDLVSDKSCFLLDSDNAVMFDRPLLADAQGFVEVPFGYHALCEKFAHPGYLSVRKLVVDALGTGWLGADASANWAIHIEPIFADGTPVPGLEGWTFDKAGDTFDLGGLPEFIGVRPDQLYRVTLVEPTAGEFADYTLGRVDSQDVEGAVIVASQSDWVAGLTEARGLETPHTGGIMAAFTAFTGFVADGLTAAVDFVATSLGITALDAGVPTLTAAVQLPTARSVDVRVPALEARVITFTSAPAGAGHQTPPPPGHTPGGPGQAAPCSPALTHTGADLALLFAALAVLGLGGLVLVAAKRRRREDATPAA